MAVTGAPGFWSMNLISELMSAKPTGNAPVATFGMASSDPRPAEISTSSPAAAKWPLSIAAKYGAEGPSNFQSSANGILVSASAGPANTAVAARAAIECLSMWFSQFVSRGNSAESGDQTRCLAAPQHAPEKFPHPCHPLPGA
jgi:hypothetical protein